MSSSWGSFALETLKGISPFSSSNVISEPKKHEFTHRVVFDDPVISKEEYWEHVMEPGFDYYVYDKHNQDAKPSERSYSVEGNIVRRVTEVELMPDTGLGVIFTTLQLDTSKPIVYVSTQQKINDGSFKIAYQNEFSEEWKEYICEMNGVIELIDEPSTENPRRFVQKFFVEIQLSFGWNTGTWLSRCVGFMTDSMVISTIEQKFIEKSNQLPYYFSNFKQLQNLKRNIMQGRE